MAQELCAICHERPAVARVSLVQNGQRRELALCELHYRQLMRQQRMRSPLESLFGGGSPFDEIFSGFGEQSPVTPVRAREPEAVDIAEYFSKQTTEYLQRAAQVAAEFGKQFPKLDLVTIDKDFGGWKTAQPKFFNDGGVFDQIYQAQ